MSDEDTKAILGRRRFLIKSSLVGSGLAAAVSGCDLLLRPCLTVLPEPPEPPKKPGTATSAPKKDIERTIEGLRPCLSVRVRDDE